MGSLRCSCPVQAPRYNRGSCAPWCARGSLRVWVSGGLRQSGSGQGREVGRSLPPLPCQAMKCEQVLPPCGPGNALAECTLLATHMPHHEPAGGSVGGTHSPPTVSTPVPARWTAGTALPFAASRLHSPGPSGCPPAPGHSPCKGQEKMGSRVCRRSICRQFKCSKAGCTLKAAAAAAAAGEPTWPFGQ